MVLMLRLWSGSDMIPVQETTGKAAVESAFGTEYTEQFGILRYTLDTDGYFCMKKQKYL